MRIKFCKPWMLKTSQPLYKTWLYEGSWGVMYRVRRVWRISIITKTRSLVHCHETGARTTRDPRFRAWLREQIGA